MIQIQQIEIGIVLLVACLTFFLLGYQWADQQQKLNYDSLGSEDDDSQLEQQLREYKQRETLYQKQIQELKKQLGMGNNNKNSDL
ncbi:unnamed protein product [Paramecium primaurelia]|uniref:Uncharacterized protein n=2 Tax=Paramecium TaxID=5884 RepID=A0A8S1SQ62_9CILI|nr:unnamed protein product [Paramecium primaurelia]CAD8141566.1 unnamed protein product [Paramecium pentaurelia]